MKFVKNLLEKMTRCDKKVLGRWNINYCDKVIKTKVDFSNDDHCGSCGDKINEITEINLKSTKEVKEWTPKQKPSCLKSTEDIFF